MADNFIFLLTWITIFGLGTSVYGWDNDDLELFDLVEEINQNFYEFMNIDQTASSADIRKAYRKLSLELHPDKNKEEGAEVKFRQLVAVYEVLKDESKRQKYESVLENGLPDWRQPVFYYRRVKKMGMLEFLGFMCSILTVGQYLVLWAVYAEKKFTLQDNFDEIRKKKEKKVKRNKQQALEDEMDQILQTQIDLIPKPKLNNLWIYRLPLWTVRSVVGLPMTIKCAIQVYKEEKERKRQEELDALLEQEEDDTVEIQKKPKKKLMSEILEAAPTLTTDGAPVVYTEMVKNTDNSDIENKSLRQGEWTDEDFATLAKAVCKFPGGTPQRWQKIAVFVGRPLSEVTSRSKTLKTNYVMNIDSSIQSGGLKTGKKVQNITEDMISQNTDLIEVENTCNSVQSDENVIRRRTQLHTKKIVEGTILPKKKESSNIQDEKFKSDIKISLNKSTESNIVHDSTIKSSDNTDTWNKNLQTIFEWGLRQYPKGTDQRWDKIAEHIPGKSKEDCIARFKYLADIVKKKKEIYKQKDLEDG